MRRLISVIESGRAVIAASVLVNLAIMVILFGVGQREEGLFASEDPIHKTSLSEGKIEYEDRIVEIVARANPAVLSIVVTEETSEGSDLPSLLDELLYLSPLELDLRVLSPQLEEHKVAGGSGFLVSSDGFAITNRHVVDKEGAKVVAFTSEGEKYEVSIVVLDPVLDIAVIKLNRARGLPYLTFGNSESLRLGQTVIAIGTVLGEFQNSVSVGVVSGLSRSIIAGDEAGYVEELHEVIQTDAAINPGNSGGPLLNLNGQVVGVNVAVALGGENIGFAIPGNAAQEVFDSLTKGE